MVLVGGWGVDGDGCFGDFDLRLTVVGVMVFDWGFVLVVVDLFFVGGCTAGGWLWFVLVVGIVVAGSGMAVCGSGGGHWQWRCWWCLLTVGGDR